MNILQGQMITKATELLSASGLLYQFIGNSQRQALRSCLRGEEKHYFAKMLIELADHIEKMPKTYDQDGKGMNAMAHLHYFLGSGDWFITEKDKDWQNDDYDQSYGFCSLFGPKSDGELGYVSIKELIENDVELDLHWTVKTIKECLK